MESPNDQANGGELIEVISDGIGFVLPLCQVVSY